MAGRAFGDIVIFFFQAEDGIRDYKVTGVQTCALPILTSSGVGPAPWNATTMDVDVGLHHASPPPSYSGNSPAWISCENVGTSRSIGVPAKRLGMSYLNAAEVIAASIRTVGDTTKPERR